MTKPKGPRVKAQAEQVKVPQSRDEAAESVAEIGRRQRERDRIAASMNDELAKVRQRYEEEAAPHKKAIEDLSRGVQVWCEAHRGELTNDGKTKTASLTTGQVSWRTRPMSVTVRGAEAVIEALKRLKLTKFIRTKEEINKEAILADPEAAKDVKGITLSQKEDFVIKPFETELEEVAT